MAAKKTEFYIQKVEGRAESCHDRIEQWVDQQPDGCYKVTVQRSYKSKTQKQLGAHFGLLIDRALAKINDEGHDTSSFLRELIRDDLPTGEPMTSDLLKILLYKACPIIRDGKRITLSKAKSHEASAHFESCRNVLARHGIYIPNPNPNWKEDANEQGHKTE